METTELVNLNQQSLLIARVILFTALSALADAAGFIYSARAFREGDVLWSSLGQAGLMFFVGLVTYWLATRDFSALGMGTPEVQFLFWFTMTIAGLALLSGEFLRWPPLDQSVAGMIVAGLCFLIVRVS